MLGLIRKKLLIMLPMLMQLGISSDLTQALDRPGDFFKYRNALMPYFLL